MYTVKSVIEDTLQFNFRILEHASILRRGNMFWYKIQTFAAWLSNYGNVHVNGQHFISGILLACTVLVVSQAWRACWNILRIKETGDKFSKTYKGDIKYAVRVYFESLECDILA